jgi:hypothetical protein
VLKQPQSRRLRVLVMSAGREAFGLRAVHRRSAAGCRFEVSAKTIQPLTKLLREELEKL